MGQFCWIGRSIFGCDTSQLFGWRMTVAVDAPRVEWDCSCQDSDFIQNSETSLFQIVPAEAASSREVCSSLPKGILIEHCLYNL